MGVKSQIVFNFRVVFKFVDMEFSVQKSSSPTDEEIVSFREKSIL